ncbi:MAG TPA: hypothetical protein VHE99_05105 [Gammaproteobacteria bacterium]|nr:hypothetical protein [Gammaproteobacteria bacterium]
MSELKRSFSAKTMIQKHKVEIYQQLVEALKVVSKEQSEINYEEIFSILEQRLSKPFMENPSSAGQDIDGLTLFQAGLEVADEEYKNLLERFQQLNPHSETINLINKRLETIDILKQEIIQKIQDLTDGLELKHSSLTQPALFTRTPNFSPITSSTHSSQSSSSSSLISSSSSSSSSFSTSSTSTTSSDIFESKFSYKQVAAFRALLGTETDQGIASQEKLFAIFPTTKKSKGGETTRVLPHHPYALEMYKIALDKGYIKTIQQLLEAYVNYLAIKANSMGMPFSKEILEEYLEPFFSLKNVEGRTLSEINSKEKVKIQNYLNSVVECEYGSKVADDPDKEGYASLKSHAATMAVLPSTLAKNAQIIYSIISQLEILMKEKSISQKSYERYEALLQGWQETFFAKLVAYAGNKKNKYPDIPYAYVKQIYADIIQDIIKWKELLGNMPRQQQPDKKTSFKKSHLRALTNLTLRFTPKNVVVDHELTPLQTTRERRLAIVNSNPERTAAASLPNYRPGGRRPGED